MVSILLLYIASLVRFFPWVNAGSEISSKLIRIDDRATLHGVWYSRKVGERECNGVGVGGMVGGIIGGEHLPLEVLWAI